MEAFASGPDGSDFATCAYAILDPASGELRYASAGHPPMLLVSPDGTARWLDDAQSLPLCSLSGVERREEWSCSTRGRCSSSTPTGSSSGGASPLATGLDRLRETVLELRRAPVTSLCDELVRRMLAHAPGDDDAVAVSVRFTPTTTRSFRQVVPARSESLAGLRASLRHWLVEAGVPVERHGDVLLLVGEAVANAVEHAYGAEHVGVVEVEACAGDDDAVALTISDRGAWHPSASEPGRGHGTSIMRALSTSFARHTGVHGTTVEVVVPLTGDVVAGVERQPAAASRPAMSSFPIPRRAVITRAARSGSASERRPGSTRGTICSLPSLRTDRSMVRLPRRLRIIGRRAPRRGRLAILEGVERDRERQHEPTVDVPERRARLDHVAVAERAEDAVVRPRLLAAPNRARS